MNRVWLAVCLGALTLTARVYADPLAATPAERRAVEALWASEAVLEAEHVSTVSAQAGGRILEINYRPGDVVPAGAVLMRIDPLMATQELVGMDARINEARVNLDNARRQFERTRSLLRENYVSQSEFDRAEAAYKAAEAQLNTLMASRGQAQASANYTTVSAPYGGVMSALHVEVGELATPGKPLATGFDPDALRATAHVPQAFVSQVRDARKAYVELNGHGEWVEAARIQVLPTADPVTHDTEVRVYLAPGLKDVMPGQFARVHFVVGNERRLVVPPQALFQRSELTAVYVLDDKGAPRLRQVRAGRVQADGSIEVLAGVREGEMIALEPVKATESAR